MKLLIMMLVGLAMVSCTNDEDNNSKKTISRLKESLTYCESSLEDAKAKLAFKTIETATTTDYNSEQEEPEEQEEPQCEDVTYSEIYVDGKLLDKCKPYSIEADACGLNAENCKSESQYHCLQNVKLKTTTIKECE